MLRSALFGAICVFVTSCASIKQKGYRAFVGKIDQNSELEISTYPAFFSSTKHEIPFVCKQRQSHEKVFFQLSVRDRKKKIGPNEHVDSILIKEFSYKLDELPRKTLLSNYREYFWMQDNPNYEKRDLSPIPYRPSGVILVEVDLNLNGKDFLLLGKMPASAKTLVYPLAMEFLR